MSNININPLFILLVGATILSLVLVTDSIYVVFAQEEEEKDKDKDDDKDEKDEEEKDEESKDKEEEEDDEKEKEESKEEDVENNNDTSTTQIIQDQLTPSSSPPINNDTTTTTTFQEPEPIALTAPPPPPPPQEGEFNATCKCKTTSPSKPTPPSNDNPTNQEQILIPITNANIKDSKSFGQVTDPAYTDFYTVPNLLDTIIDDVSFWSQAGTSGFYIHLDNALDNYQVCSAELNVLKPKSVPYLLDVGVSQNYSGVIDQPNERIQFDKCVMNMDEIYMIFDNPSGNYISISEIKLFGSKLVGAQQPPTLQPPIITSNEEVEEEETENATKINIENSTAEVDIKNSTITFKFDPLTATFVGSK